MLLIVDGHSSRLNPALLMHSLCEDVTVLNLPSHLTDILQPNDSGVNKLMKCLLDRSLLQMLEAHVTVTNVILWKMIVDAMANSTMKNCIVKSFAHCGIFPTDRSRAVRLLDDEQPDTAYQRDSLIQFAIKQTTDKLQALDWVYIPPPT